MRLNYVLQEIGTGLRRNLTMTIAVVVTVAISLSLLGAGLLIRQQANTMKDYWYDKVKTMAMMETDRPHALRQAINCCRKGGTVSVPGVYGGFPDKIPFGAIVNKSLTIRSGGMSTSTGQPTISSAA